MNFSYLESLMISWDDILVIGKSLEKHDQQCHIIGMTLLNQDANLYLLESCHSFEPV